MYSLYEQGRLSTLAASKITADDLNEYVNFRRSQGIAESTIAKDLSIIGGLLTWKNNNARQVYSVIYGNKKPRAYQGRIDPLSDDIVEKVYQLARSTSDWTTLRGCMAVILGGSAGLRPQESRRLYADHINISPNGSTVYIEHVKGEGKWGKPRRAPIMDDVEDIYIKYLKMREEVLKMKGIESRAMFPPMSGNAEFVQQQSMSRFKSYVEDIIQEKFELRDARRAFGQRMLNSGYTMEQVSTVMGHDSIKTTQKYYATYREDDVLGNIFATKNSRRRDTISA